MNADGWIARLDALGDAAWARRANPCGLASRLATFPLVVLALWSHVRLGWTAAAALVLAAALWGLVSPRLFGAPRRTDRWASRAVFGERLWLARTAVPIPPHHERAAAILSAVAGAGGAAAIVGAILDERTTLLAGGLVAALCKLWFLDRMVWLYRDMRDLSPLYASWEHR